MNHSPRRIAAATFLLTLALAPAARADNVIADDQAVQGSQCVGLDCVDNETFGFDTLRLQENNTRLAFDDTSTSPGFPANDWALQANDAASGGANAFFLQDVTGATSPFAVFAGAPTDSLRVANNGNIGLGTDSPGLKLSLKKNDTPGIRLEQDNTGGFTPQTWDVAGNEANFFVRDLTNGSKLPFRIRPGAPTSSVDIGATGNVGIGTASPGFRLDASGATTVGAPVGRLVNDGTSLLRFENAHGATTINKWDVGNAADKTFTFTPDGTTPTMTLTPGGDATAAGALEQNADPAATENRSDADAADVLAKLRTLPVKKSELTADPTNAIHLGPTGADFRAAFGLGSSDGTIAPADLASVSLVGLQALADQVETLQPANIDALRNRIGALEAATASIGTTNDRIVQLYVFGRRADVRISTLERTNKALTKRLASLEKQVKVLAKSR